ncbi:hypothetical protein ACLB2K_052271 [Fragaria x ananassa]
MDSLDYLLVPAGLFVLGLYHVWLIITVLRNPIRTVIGVNVHTRQQWVFAMMTSARYYAHVSFMGTVPTWKNKPGYVEYVAATLNRGYYFWALGLRAFYLSIPLFLWIFGPIPMFVSCCVMSVVLYSLDTTSSFAQLIHTQLFKEEEKTDNVEPIEHHYVPPFSTGRLRRRRASTRADSSSVLDHFPSPASPPNSSFPANSSPKTSHKIDLARKMEFDRLAGERKWLGMPLESIRVEARRCRSHLVENGGTSAL